MGGVNLSTGKSAGTSAKVGIALVCLFAMPFAGFGVFAMSQAIRLIGAGPGSPPFWYPLIFGVVLCSVGFGLMYVVLTGTKRYAKQQRLQAERPAEPWLWRADWAQGQVNSKTHSDMLRSWVFGVIWNLIAWPLACLVIPSVVQQKGAIGYIVGLFPAVGVLVLGHAIRETLVFFEFGSTYFEMAGVPGVIGRELKGTIHARFPHSPEHGVHLRLSCIHRVTTGSGNSQTTHESIEWRDEADLDSAQFFPGPTGTMIPVVFHIPLSTHSTEKISARDEYLWLLEGIADIPGVNYHDIFEVPVFRTADTPTVEQESTTFGAAALTATRPEHLTVEVRQNAEGTEFYFPAARNKSFAFSVTAFAAIFSTVTYFLMHVRVIFIFPLVFGFFSLLLVYFSVQLWLGTTRVIIGRSLKLQAGILGGGKVQEFALTDIRSISDRIMAQSGGGTGTAYYDIGMTLNGGKNLTLGRSLPNKREAEWLLSEMRRLAQFDQKSMSAGMA